MITLQRPLVFADFETTGTNVEKDRIVQYSFCKIFPDGQREIKTALLNPGIPIPAGATEIHGIKNEDVIGKPSFKDLSPKIFTFIENCDLGGYNSNSFDFPMLFFEFARAGITWNHSEVCLLDACNIFKIKESRTLAAAVKFYTGKELEGSHDAEVDIMATVDVFFAQLEKYEDLPKTLPELDIYCNYSKKRLDMKGCFVLSEDGKTILFNIGKDQKGKPAHSDYGFLSWMAYSEKKEPFPPDTIALAKKIMGEIKAK